jgi:hypothetical protein
MRNADKVTFAELCYEAGKNELTCLDRIFFWSWPDGTAALCVNMRETFIVHLRLLENG